MALSASGIGSGLDVNSIVSQLMAVERQPIDALNRKQSSYNTKLSDFGKLQSALSTLRSAADALRSSTKFASFNAVSSDTSAYTATASSSASTGTYSISVSAIAKAERRISDGVATSSEAIATVGSTLTIQGQTITITDANNSLAGLRDAINSTANIGVSASIVFDGTSNHLVLNGTSTGVANALTISTSDAGTVLSSISGALSATPGNQAAANASLTVDGMPVSSASNTITDAIQGVTLNLTNTTASPVALSVSTDTASVKSKIDAFVTAYNQLKSTAKTLGAGSLQGDSTLRSIQSELSREFGVAASGLSGGYSYLSDIGISLQKDGTLAVDASKLNSALSSNFSGVQALFADSSQGFANRFYTKVDGYIASTGLISTRTEGLNKRISQLDAQKLNLENRMAIIEKRYRAQFTALDKLIGSMNSTSNFLTQQLAGLPGSSSSAN